MLLLGAFLAAVLVINAIVLSVFLRNRTASASSPQRTATALPLVAATAEPQQRAAPVVPSAATTSPVAATNVAAQSSAPQHSSRIRVKYSRDPKTHIRSIAIEDAGHPGASTVLYQSPRPAWALVSPNDEWVVVNERASSDGGGARLYRRQNNDSVQYAPSDGASNDSVPLRDAVWKAYLAVTHGDSSAPRHNVTIDATGWDNDGRKLVLAVTHLPNRDQPDVPEPWSCTYDLASKQIEPVAGQPNVDPAAIAAAQAQAEQTEQTTDNSEEQPRTGPQQAADTAGNPFADNAAEQDETAAAEEDDNQYPGEKFPATRLDELTVPDVNESSLEEITYAINEMFARHNAPFKDRKVTKQFEGFAWYKPRPGFTYDEVEKEFSDLEKANLKVLARCRDSKLAATRRSSKTIRGRRVQQEEPNGAEIMRQVLQGMGVMP